MYDKPTLNADEKRQKQIKNIPAKPFSIEVDPRRKDIASSDEDGNKYVLSGKKYYQYSKFVKRTRWIKRQIKHLGLDYFLFNVPSSITHHSESSIAQIKYLKSMKKKCKCF